jgi:hypothetical protein
MPFVKAEFDGNVFVPCQPVDLPAGTRVEVVVPPPAMTPEQARQWEAIATQIESSAPHFSTVDEALRYSRKRP